MPGDYHVIIVIVVMQGASPLRDIRVEDLAIKISSKCHQSYQSLQHFLQPLIFLSSVFFSTSISKYSHL